MIATSRPPTQPIYEAHGQKLEVMDWMFFVHGIKKHMRVVGSAWMRDGAELPFYEVCHGLHDW